jgi:hypothetical protein
MKLFKSLLVTFTFWLNYLFSENNFLNHKRYIPESYKYTKKIYDYTFKSMHDLDIKSSLAIIKELINISTKYDIGNKTSIDSFDQSYAIDIRKLMDKYKLDNKQENVYELVSWLHYYDENKKDYFHYEPSFVYYYLSQVDVILEIYQSDFPGDYKCNVAGLHSVLEHFENTACCIEQYIIDYNKQLDNKGS